MAGTTTQWVVAINTTGHEDTNDVYQTADSRADAIRVCQELNQACPEWFCEALSWEEAEAAGLVS